MDDAVSDEQAAALERIFSSRAAAMMFPSIAPIVLTYARIQRTTRERGLSVIAGATVVFVAGYLVSWTAAGLGFYGVLAAARAPAPEAGLPPAPEGPPSREFLERMAAVGTRYGLDIKL